ncbi:hypothetical protein ATE49_07490 [Elizabethkingia miricola]|uniref:DUF4013 domain-containing protein n=1 Tax=Elizabethkingia miricola TaxID=172045 RepID=A0ABY3NDU1_ELIMR|nr:MULTISPECIES: hypothetical protein [Elizabethkingia]KUG11149.1 hypothetical protein AMC91_11855 [Elizabethkingia miricola]MCL1658019.1 hypothetical protein [Elizabethkingia miricola]OBS11496.1 hypothetical protein ATE49_07490 [Elizabethkingia miricola]OIK45411.1 hypothetical protein BEI02_04200 [Elizabethkingia sp. HvH-WGS333]OPC07767.1 hypothetical protein BAY01_15300 [Elizabethkingia miricola]
MMQFYKKRDFGALVSDTLNFFKLYGKNYFKNYLTLNGGIIILLVVVIVIGFGDFFKQAFGSNINGEAYLFQDYFQQNQGLLIGASVLSIVLIILLSLISYSFPVLYMKRLAETGNSKVTMNEMIEDMKKNLKKFFVFFIGSIFILTPLFIFAFIISSFLMIILIGFLLIMACIPVMVNIINFTLFNMYNTNDGFFASIGKAFRMQFSKSFWKYIGSTFIIYLLINVVTSIFAFIPMMFLYGYILTTVRTTPDALGSDSSFFMTLMAIVYAVSIACTIVLNNLIYVNAGFMYYDSRTDLHRNVTFSEIDTIGSGE